MTDWKDPVLLLSIGNTGGLAIAVVYLTWQNSALQKQITELNNKYDVLYKKIGGNGGDGKLYDFISDKIINKLPASEKATAETFARANKELKKLRNRDEDIEYFISDLMELLTKYDLGKMDDKEAKNFKDELSKLEVPGNNGSQRDNRKDNSRDRGNNRRNDRNNRNNRRGNDRRKRGDKKEEKKPASDTESSDSSSQESDDGDIFPKK